MEPAQEPSISESPHRSPRLLRRKLLFRGTAVLLGLFPLLLLEGVLVLAGWGRPDPRVDPFVGFSELHPLFVLNDEGTAYQVAPNRLNFFAPEGFPAQKPDNGFRIFCLGGSTVQGNPYSIETAFSTFLELALKEANPDRDWEVINCGGVSYASYRLVPILLECLNYEPDLVILCTGHNEFLEDRTYRLQRRVPVLLQRPLDWLSQRRLVVLAERGFRKVGLKPDLHKPRLGPETDPVLDYHDSLRAYHRDPVWADRVARHYTTNLERMVEICRQRQLPVLFLKPMSNLNSCPPFKTVPDEHLTRQQREAFETLLRSAKTHESTDLIQAIALLEEALAIDPLHALAWYELGQCREAHGDTAGAREAYLQARDTDVCPLRMTGPLADGFDMVVSEFEIPCLDGQALLEGRTRRGILGGYWMVDHVHPAIEGHQLLALELARLMQEQNLIELPADWEETCTDSLTAYMGSLDRSYFYRGQRQLEALRGWTQGRADGPSAATRFPQRVSRP